MAVPQLPVLPLLLLGAYLTSRGADAVTWKLFASVPANLNSWIGYPPDDPSCTVQGVCSFYNTTLANNTIWYWCGGWKTKYRTEYWVNSKAGPLTAALMRQDQLESCALPNLSNIKNCQTVDNSLCDTSTRCYQKVYGFSFVDPVCLVVANNEKSSADVSIQMWQYHDSRRYYGTIFSILLFILVVGFAFGHMAFTCYHQCRKPNHRLDELERMTRAKLQATAAAAPPDPDAPAIAPDASEGMSSHAASGSTTKRIATNVARPSAGAGPSGSGGAAGDAGSAGGARATVTLGLAARTGTPPAEGKVPGIGGGLMDRVKAMVGVGSDGCLSKGGHHH